MRFLRHWSRYALTPCVYFCMTICSPYFSVCQIMCFSISTMPHSIDNYCMTQNDCPHLLLHRFSRSLLISSESFCPLTTENNSKFHLRIPSRKEYFMRGKKVFFEKKNSQAKNQINIRSHVNPKTVTPSQNVTFVIGGFKSVRFSDSLKHFS